jgi:hypothetical protein
MPEARHIPSNKEFNMNQKTPILATLTIALVFALALISCDNGNDNPKGQSTPITNLFGGNYSATVTGFYSNAQWSGVPNKVKNLLDAGYGATVIMGQGILKTYFENNAVVIKVQSDPVGYTKYKVDSTEAATIYFNLGALNSLTAEDVASALTRMRSNASESQ